MMLGLTKKQWLSVAFMYALSGVITFLMFVFFILKEIWEQPRLEFMDLFWFLRQMVTDPEFWMIWSRNVAGAGTLSILVLILVSIRWSK